MPIRKPFFVIPLALGTMTTGNAQTGSPVTNLNRAKAIGLTWKTTGSTTVWARGNFAAAGSINFMALIAANALSGTLIRLRLGTTQAEVDGAAAPYDSTALAFISPAITRADGLYHSHLELGSTVSATWWRIDITGHTGDFEAATLVLGKTITPGRFYDSGFESGVRDLGSLDLSPFGVFDDTEGAIFRTIDFTLGWVTEAEFEASFRPMIETLGSRGVVYLCFDPEATTYRQSKTYLGILAKPPFAKGVKKPATFALDWQFISMI